VRLNDAADYCCEGRRRVEGEGVAAEGESVLQDAVAELLVYGERVELVVQGVGVVEEAVEEQGAACRGK
jgi:hypothetical protein